ncbi:MAG: response regulator [Thermodesulfovibrionia bacterium]|nr:response regulator [Thermodesulfovibrionia bacterium]
MKKDKQVILIVDDQPENIELLEAHLVTQGYEIIQAESGEEALRILSGDRVDLVLLDVKMPRMSGFEVLAKLRADIKTERIPVIMVTAYTEYEEKVKALEAGCDDFITKPFDKHELLSRVRSLLRIKLLNDEVDEAHEFSESVINTVREPLIVLDSDLRVFSANRSFYTSFKVTPQETIGNFIYDLGNRQWDIPKLRTLLEDILPKNNKFDDYEVEHVFSNIGHKIMLLNARRITHKEKGSHMILLAIEDITKSRKLERERKNILSMFAHDMKNPAVTSEGFLSRLISGKAGALTEEQQNHLGIIHSELNKLSQLLSDFLQFSRFEAIEYKPVYALFNIEEEIRKNIEAEKVEAEKKKIIICLENPDAITPQANADAAMVNRVIRNLLVNAIKYTDPEGTVTIKISDRGKEILVSVKDTGIGIPADQLPYIFDAFYRAGNSKGSGLGLSIAKAIIEGHGGSIWAESIPANGSTFSFTLPKEISEFKRDGE